MYNSDDELDLHPMPTWLYYERETIENLVADTDSQDNFYNTVTAVDVANDYNFLQEYFGGGLNGALPNSQGVVNGVGNTFQDVTDEFGNDVGGDSKSVYHEHSFFEDPRWTNLSQYGGVKWGVAEITHTSSNQGERAFLTQAELKDIYLLQDVIIEDFLDKTYCADVAGRAITADDIMSTGGVWTITV